MPKWWNCAKSAHTEVKTNFKLGLQIIRLEAERTQWEQRYLEESAMRQVAIDAASIPKDAKIAALEKNSAESDKIIADARSDKMKQFEELQNMQVRLDRWIASRDRCLILCVLILDDDDDERWFQLWQNIESK